MTERRKGAIVTGASCGIGRAISEKLCERQYEVYGIGRDFGREDTRRLLEDNPNFHACECDVRDSNVLIQTIEKIMNQTEIHVLVNNAGVGYYGLLEHLNAKQICEMVRVNLEVPMVLTSILMRTLKEHGGLILNVASVTAENKNPHGCVYGATKAGLLSFGDSLFEEARKYGIRVTTILPDMTDTELYRNADFGIGEEKESYLTPEQVAEAVGHILDAESGIVVPKLVLRPQIHRIQRKR